ncbi:MAG: division plane positioning ATPase MipZ [Acetobacter sp.]|nr:division plane positioning ATPase MipZ [Acetobacter sp.]
MPEIKAHVIIIDGESGVGKKMLGFELALTLLYNQQKTALLLSPDSPLKKTLDLRKQNFPQLPHPNLISREEFHTAINNYDAIIIPTTATDELAITAETFITLLPKNKKSIINFQKNKTYINTLWELKKKRAASYRRSLDWVICENNLKNKNNTEPSIELTKIAKMYGFRLCPPLNNRSTYQANVNGISAQDKVITELNNQLTYEDICAKREIIKLAEFIFS